MCALRKKWVATIHIKGGKAVNLGTFSTREEAAMAFDAEAFAQRGRNANLNFPELWTEDGHQNFTSTDAAESKPSSPSGDDVRVVRKSAAVVLPREQCLDNPAATSVTIQVSSGKCSDALTSSEMPSTPAPSTPMVLDGRFLPGRVSSDSQDGRRISQSSPCSRKHHLLAATVI